MTVRRIFHIQPGTDGGTERFFLTLAAAFHGRGVQQAFAIRPGRAWRAEAEPLGAIHEGQYLRRTPGGLLDHWRLRRAIRDFKPDAVLAWRAPAARLIPRHIAAAKVVRLGDYPRHVRHFTGLDAVACNNPSIARHIRGLGWAGDAPVISNFVRPIAPVPIDRASLETPERAFVVCGAGRLTRVKGFDLLIDAVAQLPAAHLWLVGDGDQRDALREQAARAGLAGRVKFLGWRDDPTAVIAAADAFVLPSRDEPLGNALLEAWGAGVASVATRTDGPNWYATHERDCLLVPADDARAIAAALARLQSDRALRDGLARAARATLAQNFSEGGVVDAYLELFDRVPQGLASQR